MRRRGEVLNPFKYWPLSYPGVALNKLFSSFLALGYFRVVYQGCSRGVLVAVLGNPKFLNRENL